MLFLIFLSVILLIVSFAITPALKTKLPARIIRIVAVVILAVGILSSCIVQIAPGQVGVQTIFGKVMDQVLPSGLHVINPFVVVKRFDVRTENYTMSGVADEGNQSGDDAIRVLTSDGLELTMDVSVLYRVISNRE